MQNIEQFVVKERQEIKPLQTCESYFLTFQKGIRGVSVRPIRFALQKTGQVYRRFYQDPDVAAAATTGAGVIVPSASSTASVVDYVADASCYYYNICCCYSRFARNYCF